MENIYQTVIDSLHNEVMTLRKQVKKLEKVIEAQKQEAIIVQCGLDFLEMYELSEEIRRDIAFKKVIEGIVKGGKLN
jgi:aryl carrier-like protein